MRPLRDFDLSAIWRQHPDRNLETPSRWVNDTHGPISPLRFAKDLQSNATERMKGVEDLNICIIRTQGIVGVGAAIRTSTASCPAAAYRLTIGSGSGRRRTSSCR